MSKKKLKFEKAVNSSKKKSFVSASNAEFFYVCGLLYTNFKALTRYIQL